MQSQQTLCPMLRWAQNQATVYITVMVSDIINQTTKITNNTIAFKGETRDKKYEVSLELYGQVDDNASRVFKTGSSLRFELAKKEKGKKWKRLTQDAKKLAYVLIDWDRWDEVSQQQEQEMSSKKYGNSLNGQQQYQQEQEQQQTKNRMNFGDQDDNNENDNDKDYKVDKGDDGFDNDDQDRGQEAKGNRDDFQEHDDYNQKND